MVVIFGVCGRSFPSEHRTAFHSLCLCLCYAELVIAFLDESLCFTWLSTDNVSGIKALLSTLDNSNLVAGLNKDIAFLWHRRSQRNNRCLRLLHPFCELANVVEIASDLDVIIVDISANTICTCSISESESHLIAVSYSELLDIVRSDKANAFFCVLHVSIKPIFHVAVAIKIVFTLVRIEPQEIGVFFSINPDAKIILLCIHFALRV